MDSSKFVTRTFSKLPQLQSNNNIGEQTALSAYIDLMRVQYSDERYQKRNYVVSERDLKEKADSLSRPNYQTVLVFVEDIDAGRVVGFGTLVKGNGYLKYGKNVGMLGEAFVLPEYRNQGIYTSMVVARETIAMNIGYDQLVVEPADDGKSESVLIKMGYSEISKEPSYEEGDEMALIKTLKANDKEKEILNIDAEPNGFKL